MAWPTRQSNCSLQIMWIVSIPATMIDTPKCLEVRHWARNGFDGRLQKTPNYSQIPFGREKEVDRVARPRNGAILVFPFASSCTLGAFADQIRPPAQPQRVGQIPTHARQQDFQRKVDPFEYLAQRAIDQTFAEIKPGSNCPVSLSRQNQIRRQSFQPEAHPSAANATNPREV